MPTLTPNYSLQKPVVGADDNEWGGYQNDAFDIIDAQMKANADAIAALTLSTQTPVGGLYLSTTDTNPAATLGYGTWAAHAAGRALIGVGSNGQSNWTVDRADGAESHTLQATEMPGHTHNAGSLTGTTNSTGNHTHTHTDGYVTGTTIVDSTFEKNTVVAAAGADRTLGTSGASIGDHSHSVSLNGGVSGTTGGGQPHNNIQPSIAVYVWRRTA